MARRYIDVLQISFGAEEELARHSLTVDEVLEVRWDDPAFFRDKEPERDLMIGRTEAGRLLTIVVEESHPSGVWDVITGWQSSKGERTVWKKARPRLSRR
jgi:uncharacterized DUF497 family protein